jgi:hypothetical protein
MTFSVVIPSTLHFAGLRLLCAIGGCAGFMVVLLGLRLERKKRCAPQEFRPDSAEAEATEKPATAQSIVLPEVIQLSTISGPARSSEMTQQQKIAAALSRAGMTNSGWSQPEIYTATALLEPPVGSVTKPDPMEDFLPLPPPSNFKRKLILLAGATLALLSLGLLLILR